MLTQDMEASKNYFTQTKAQTDFVGFMFLHN
jgi:hypothetical protein